ncbi:hypothetical protein E4U21_003360 [Claviceps maximensis]|nr:hypothetical protein E4U21_003360 [Claviceps maximensis]
MTRPRTLREDCVAIQRKSLWWKASVALANLAHVYCREYLVGVYAVALTWLLRISEEDVHPHFWPIMTPLDSDTNSGPSAGEYSHSRRGRGGQQTRTDRLRQSPRSSYDACHSLAHLERVDEHHVTA